MEHEIFAIQQERIQVHKKFESAFSYSQTDFAKYRTELGTFSEFGHFYCYCRQNHHRNERLITKSYHGEKKFGGKRQK